MEDSKKKLIMIAIIVVSFTVVGWTLLKALKKESSGLDSIPEDKMTWVKCNNPQCKAEYEMGEKQFFKALEGRLQPMLRSTPALTCDKCSKDSLYRAEKCPYCGVVFFRDSVPNDLYDRCPECGKSAIEESRKQRISGG